jgi:hypothetical protein
VKHCAGIAAHWAGNVLECRYKHVPKSRCGGARWGKAGAERRPAARTHR